MITDLVQIRLLAWLPNVLPICAHRIDAIDHDCQGDPLHLRLIMHNRPHRLADLIIRGLFLASFLAAGRGCACIGVGKVVL